jgi:hypothetical protein
LVYRWYTRYASPDDKAKFDAELEKPPTGEDPEYVSEESAADDFAAWRAAASTGIPGARTTM